MHNFAFNIQCSNENLSNVKLLKVSFYENCKCLELYKSRLQNVNKILGMYILVYVPRQLLIQLKNKFIKS